MSILETKEISKSYRGRRVVDDVSLSRGTGRGGGIAGPQRRRQDHIVLHHCRPDHPGFRPRSVDGEDITSLPMYKRARRGISYLPQEASVFRKLTVEENLMAILETLPMSAANAAKAWTN